MSETSKIEWTDATWNPVRGCTKISPGCSYCYAETFAERFRGVPGHPYERGFDLRLVPERLLDPLLWPKSKMVFVNSMSDLFHEGIPNRYISAVTRVMSETPWHIYQVLTKRSQRLRDLLGSELQWATQKQHIWWGVSVENRKVGFPRIEDLRAATAAIRFLSIEPLLEDLGEIDLSRIDWVIVGGESGHGARPMKEAWVLSILDQCRVARVPFFFKQWGGVHKKAAGRLLSGVTFDEFPRIDRATLPDRQSRERALAEIATQLSDIVVIPNRTSSGTDMSLKLFPDY